MQAEQEGLAEEEAQRKAQAKAQAELAHRNREAARVQVSVLGAGVVASMVGLAPSMLAVAPS